MSFLGFVYLTAILEAICQPQHAPPEQQELPIGAAAFVVSSPTRVICTPTVCVDQWTFCAAGAVGRQPSLPSSRVLTSQGAKMKR